MGALVSRVFMICPEPVRTLTAGVGTRFVALAEVLSGAGHSVTLAIPNEPLEARAVHPPVRVVQAVPDALGGQADDHDFVLLHGHLGNHFLAQRDDLPVVVDLYDPFLVENLHYHRELGFEPYRTDHATWKLQLGRGDFFLCSSVEQRFFYIGWLGALGRINPLTLEDDPTLEGLIAEVPFGTPSGDPPNRSRASGILDGVSDEASVLYYGGIYDWYDPSVVLDALPSILDRIPETVLVFVDHPHPEDTPRSAASVARRTAEERGWLGEVVRFEAWRPFERRFELASAADLAVVTHRPGLETDLSLRTRIVDLLWLGLPVVSTGGGTMARVIDEIGAGETVPPGDPNALADAVLRLLGDADSRASAGAAGRRWAATRSWKKVAKPLLDFAVSPTCDRHRDRFAELGPAASTADEPAFNRMRRVLRRLRGRG
jgi:glycosyltransferase involved in cell wall biosynthesis